MLATIVDNNYSLIILDVWLTNSDLDGIEILKKLRETSLTPVIIISGHGNIEMAVKAIKGVLTNLLKNHLQPKDFYYL